MKTFATLGVAMFTVPTLWSLPGQTVDPSAVQNEKFVRLQPGVDEYNLAPYLYLYNDKTGELTIDEIRNLKRKEPGMGKKTFRLNTLFYPVIGFVRGALWVKINIDASALREGARELPMRYLKLNYFPLKYVDFYLPGPDGAYRKVESGQVGRETPKTFAEPMYTVAVPLHNEVQTLFIRIESPNHTMETPLGLYSEAGLRHENSFRNIFQGIYYGVMLVMLLYNLFIYFTVKDRAYLYYCLYILFSGLFFFALHGRLHIFMEDHYRLYQNTFVLIIGLAIFFPLLFARQLLQTRNLTPLIDRFLQLYMVLAIVFIVSAMLIDRYPYIFYFYLLLSICILVLSAGIRLYKRYQYARIFTHAWLIYLTLLTLFALRVFNMPFPMLNYTLEVGSMLEIVMLSFALAYRIRHLQDENRQYAVVQRELKMASEVQKYLFPGPGPGFRVKDKQRNPELEYTISGKFLPSTNLSGDYYDYYVDHDRKLYVFMVDVAGHGYSSGLVASMTKVAFHETLARTSTVEHHQQEINRILCDSLKNLFATAINIRIDPLKKEFSFVRSGHTPLLHFQVETKGIMEYSPRGMPLGITKEYSLEELTVSYQSGDRLFFYTDGLTEQKNLDNKEYGLVRLKTRIEELCDYNVEIFTEAILIDVTKWKQNTIQKDDVTFIAIDLH